MQVVNILGFIIAMFLISVHYSTKIIDWYQKNKFFKYKNQSAEFISDLYKIKMKWAKRGEFMYCKALDSVIGAELISDKDALPQTEEGREYLEKMKEILREETEKNSKAFDF